MNSGSRLPPNYSISNSIISSREPRHAEGALGPLSAKLRKRIGPDKFEAWFAKCEAELVSQTADTITIAVRNKFFVEKIQNRFESDIVACSGASQIEFVVKDGKETR